MTRSTRPEQLDKFLAYVLAREPDEFGLVPDRDGWIRLKDLFQALSEEEDWRYVRRSHINEILLTLHAPSVSVDGERIRARSWDGTWRGGGAVSVPKLLFVCVRRRAHPVVTEKGIVPMGHPYVVMAAQEEMALRMGKRRDPHPVLLSVQTQKAMEKGVTFCHKGERLYAAEHIPVGCFTGPPVAEPPARTESKPMTDPAELYGAFFVEPWKVEPWKVERSAQERKTGKKKRGWKEDARSVRRKRPKEPYGSPE